MKTICRITAAALIFLGFGFSAYAQETNRPRLITVTGDAEVKVVPDEVVITLGVQTDDKDINIAKFKNDECMKNVFATAKELGIESKYIQTSHINVEPRYKDYQRELLGYYVRKTVLITLKDTAKLEDLLTKMLAQGVNHIYGVRFKTTELRKYRDQARAMAIRAAQEKAVALAKELGQKVGRPYSINEHSSSWQYWGDDYFYGYNRQAQGVNLVTSGDSSSGSEGTIALGQISVFATVTVSFELE